ncbi:hypothetical protein, partial [Echinicola sediminis]
VRLGGECTETHRKVFLIPWNSVESERNKFTGVIPDNRILQLLLLRVAHFFNVQAWSGQKETP